VNTPKKRKAVDAKLTKGKIYTLSDACALLKDLNTTKFNSSVDLHIRLGVDPRKPDQALRGTVTLPHGTGKVKRVLVLCTPDKEDEARAAGADHVGLDEYVNKIKGGWTDVDVIIATPNVMAQVGQIGRILGPRNLMPNPKTGTVTPNVGAAVAEVKKGKISFRVDKFGIIHSSVGRINFAPDQLRDNAAELLHTIQKMKPASAKGIFFKSLYLATTMSPGLQVDIKSISGL
jgi:large subunit ribosomal protein L1